ncbi:MAG TPA: DUF4293 domain-containing protein [Lentimicrobium sp.]|nr:DUF4293 domain-containing protein [Lentimicrobium sp.]
MIQRIQSVYLFLAVMALVVLYFFPVASFLSEISYYKFYITNLKPLTPGAEAPVSNSLIMPLGIFNGIIAAIALMSIFLYKKRIFQSRMVKLAILMTIILIALVFFVYTPLISKATGAEAKYDDSFGIYISLIAIVMLVLANRGIMHDEKLVRSANRLR